MATKKQKQTAKQVEQAVDAASTEAASAAKPRTATDVLNSIYAEVSKFKPEVAVQLPAGVVADLVKIIAMHESALATRDAKAQS